MSDDKTLVVATLDRAPFEKAFGRGSGVRCFIATLADDAAALCERLRADVLLADFRLDGPWNGYRLAKRVSALEACKGHTQIHVMLHDYKPDAADGAWASHVQWARNSGAAGLMPRDPMQVRQLLLKPGAPVAPSPRKAAPVVADVRGTTLPPPVASLDQVDTVVRKLLVAPVAKVVIDRARQRVASGALQADDYASFLGHQLGSEEARARFFASLEEPGKSQFMSSLGSNRPNVEFINQRFAELMGPAGPRFARAIMARFGEQGVDFSLRQYTDWLAQSMADERRRQRFLDSVHGLVH